MASPIREKQANRRIRLLLALFALVFAAMFARAFWLQGVQAAHLSALARAPARGDQTIPAGRGTIFDRTGVQLAIGEQKTTIYADPQQVRNARAIALAAHEILGVDANMLYPQLLNKKSSSSTCSGSPTREGELFLKKGFAGIGSYPEELRTYPQDGVARAGARLRGRRQPRARRARAPVRPASSRAAPGKQTIVRDPTGRAIDVISSRPGAGGPDVFTTLDHTIQAQAEKVLRETVAQWGAKDATAIVLDPSTGEVLAMAQTPGYDANNTSNVARTRRAPAQPRRHRHLRAGVDLQARHDHRRALRRIVTPSTRSRSRTRSGTAPAGQCTVHDAETRGTVNYSVAQILSYSSNVGAVTIAEKLGAPRLATG